MHASKSGRRERVRASHSTHRRFIGARRTRGIARTTVARILRLTQHHAFDAISNPMLLLRPVSHFPPLGKILLVRLDIIDTVSSSITQGYSLHLL
eukprot:COSAG01_NODE_2894_length_6905_cov_2.168822_6_plen_95_part_00